MDKKIIEFVNSLRDIENLPDVFNQYSEAMAENEIRRKNLLLYLTEMQLLKTKVMLVGEAPGYHGCRFTGVPFTSEYIMLNGLSEILGSNRGYCKTDELENIKKEQSATIIWETLLANDFLPLMWNAFPFHPHKSGDCMKNRAPLAKELEIGQQFLEQLIKTFGITKIVAVGNKADRTLKKMNIECFKVRHPANGGKADFVNGIQQIMTHSKP